MIFGEPGGSSSLDSLEDFVWGDESLLTYLSVLHHPTGDCALSAFNWVFYNDWDDLITIISDRKNFLVSRSRSLTWFYSLLILNKVSFERALRLENNRLSSDRQTTIWDTQASESEAFELCWYISDFREIPLLNHLILGILVFTHDILTAQIIHIKEAINDE